MRDDQARLHDIAEAIRIIRRYTPAERAMLDLDLPIQSVLIRFLQVIGEASWRLSDALKKANPQVPWQRISSMRHVLVHDYFRIDLDQVWTVATIHIPQLEAQIQSILSTFPPSTSTPQP